MDIFNKKKIAELEKTIEDQKKTIARLNCDVETISSIREDLERDVADAYKKVIDIQNTLDKTPSGCEPGRQCIACEFGKAYYIPTRRRGYGDYIYICGKAESCQNFVKNMEVKAI